MSRSLLVLQYSNKKNMAWYTQDVRLAYDFPNVCA